MERTWLRIALRRNWRSLAGLAALVALATAVVGGAAAGAARAQTALPRLMDRTAPATLNVLPNDPTWDWDVVRDLPGVAALAVYNVTDVALVDGAPDRIWLSPDTFEGVEEPVVLDGRLPAPGAVDEVVVTPGFVSATGKGAGDTVTIQMYRPDTVAAALVGSGPSEAVPAPDGPDVTATIVGEVRSYWSSLVDNDYSTYMPDGGVMYPAAFGERYRLNLSGDPAATAPYSNAYVRLDGGAEQIPEFLDTLADATGVEGIDVWNMEERRESVRASIDFEVWALRAFAAAAAIASIVLVGQAASRSAAAGAADLGALVGSGLSRRRRVRLAALPVSVAAGVGAAIGLVAAGGASAWFPIGTAAIYEPDPGIRIAVPVLAAVGLAAVAVTVATGAVGAWFTSGSATGTRLRPSFTPAAVARLGAPVPLVTGTRFALDPGVRGQAIPVRPTLVAVVAGVAGLVATVVFAGALDDAAADPRSWGETWALVAPYDPGPDSTVTDLDGLVQAFRDTPGVTEATASASSVLRSNGRSAAVWSWDSTRPPRYVLISGRPAEALHEVVLGPTTAKRWDAEVGDDVVVSAPDGEHELRVVGLGLTPSGSHSDYDNAAWVGSDTFSLLTGADSAAIKDSGILVWSDPAVDAEGLGAALAATSSELTVDGSPLPAFPQEQPGKIAALDRVGALPQALGLFLVVLGVGAMAHALHGAIVHRRTDLAVLRAVGQTPGQTRLVAFTQAAVIGLVGVVIGTPIGVAIGRALWRVMADSTPLAYSPPSWVIAAALAVPATAAAAIAVAAWPARRAARLRITEVLRSE